MIFWPENFRYRVKHIEELR